jgi:putative DNA methylase
LNDNNQGRPRVYIEESFPIDFLNQQVLKETRGSPFSAVHRWFSRKPLGFSRASVLASLLPADTTNEDFMRLLGVPPFANKDFRLYQQTPSQAVIEEVHERCTRTWGDNFQVIDAFAGGVNHGCQVGRIAA